MSVNIDYVPAREQGNGTKLDFDFTFKIFAASDLVVGKVLRSTDVETPMVLNVDYTVVINTVTEGGTVYYTSAPTTLQDSFIRRLMDITQEADIPTNNLFREVQIENAFDKGTMIDQQQQVEIDRSIKIGETVLIDPILPTPDPGKALLWNPTGDALINSTDNFNDIQTAAAASAAAAAVSEGNAAVSAAAAAVDAIDTAADAVDTAADAVQTAADRVQTGLDRVQTGLDAAATAADAVATAADAVQTGLDAAAAAASEAAAANYAAALTATSTTSLLIAVASRTFTTQAGKQFAAGQFISAVSAANNANYMHGQVTSYSGTTLVVNVTDIGGSGTLADWNLSVSGSRGSAGASGSSSFIGLTDVPASFAGASLQAVRVNAGQTALEFYTPASAGVRGTFVDGDLTAGILTIIHSRALATPFTLLLVIADNAQKQIIPDEVTFLTNTITVDLTSYGTLTGTWGFYYI